MVRWESVAPTQFAPIIWSRNIPCVEQMRWGLAPEASKPLRTGNQRINIRAETSIALHIETRTGYEDFANLVTIPEVDMVYCGPGDSSVELGHPGNYDHPEVRKPMKNVLKLCLDNGVYFGTTPSGPESAAE